MILHDDFLKYKLVLTCVINETKITSKIKDKQTP